MQNEKTNTIILLYELGHVEKLERFWRERLEDGTESLVVALTPNLETALKKRNIHYSSGCDYRPLDTNRFILAEKWTSEIFESPDWKWFQYRDIQLSRMYSFSLQLYFVQLLYYATIVDNLFVKYPNIRRLVIFPSLQSVPPRGRALEYERIAAVVACAKLIGIRNGIEVIVPEVIRHQGLATDTFIFSLKRFFLEFGINIWNTCVSILRPLGTPRILASDYWRNIAPIISSLPRGELILFDRGEIFKAGLRNIWHFRIRLFHFSSFSIRRRETQRAEAQKLFEKQWGPLRDHGLPECSFHGFSLRPLLAKALDGIILREASKALRDIDGAYEMFKTLAPDIIFLRASVSAQIHFFILAMVARTSGIPSLELQHGLEYLGPGSISKQHSAEYVAVYGQIVQDEFAALGFPREKFPIVGSPRFDAYKKEAALARREHREKAGISVLCIGFVVDMEWFYDDYDLKDYYSAIAQALEKVPNSLAVIKLRPGPFHENSCRSMINRIFARVPYTIVQYEPLSELFASADIVISYYSTVILEALQFSKPTIVFSAQQMEKEYIHFHFARYADSGGLIIADTQEELEAACSSLAGDSDMRARLTRGAEETVKQFYRFDGRASERIVELIERLAREKNEHKCS